MKLKNFPKSLFGVGQDGKELKFLVLLRTTRTEKVNNGEYLMTNKKIDQDGRELTNKKCFLFQYQEKQNFWLRYAGYKNKVEHP